MQRSEVDQIQNKSSGIEQVLITYIFLYRFLTNDVVSGFNERDFHVLVGIMTVHSTPLLHYVGLHYTIEPIGNRSGSFNHEMYK